MPKSKTQSQDQSFEKLFSELESIVSKLDAGDLSLDESLALFQRGTLLAKKCADLLDHAELRIKELAPQALSAREELNKEEFEEDGDEE